MKTSTFRNLRRLLTHAGGAFVFLATIGLAGTGCDGGREGDRCNPLLSHNDCNDGLLCQQPATCVESYCCPANASSSSNPYCNGQGCPPADSAPATGTGDDGSAEVATATETGSGGEPAADAPSQ